jgi:hypothetical protein
VSVSLGDVRGRQPGDHPAAFLGELDQLVDGADRKQQVPVGELDALRRPGGARGVDQGEEVVRLDRLDRLGWIEIWVHLHHLVERMVASLAVDDD